MDFYIMAATAMAFILAALLLREKVRRTEAIEEAEALRGQVKALRTVMQSDRAEYIRAYRTLEKAGYTDKGHPMWTPPPDLERTAQKMEQYRDTIKELRKIVRRQWQETGNLKRANAIADLRDRCVSDDWPPYGHGIEDAESKGERHV